MGFDELLIFMWLRHLNKESANDTFLTVEGFAKTKEYAKFHRTMPIIY